MLIHAIPVVPEPAQLSKTKSPSLVYVLIRYSNNATGFCVGCKDIDGCGFSNVIIDNGCFKFPNTLELSTVLNSP